MKKLLLAFALLSITAISFADSGPVGRSGSLDGAGNFQGPAENWFINAKNVSGGTLAAGSVVILDQTEKDGYSVNTTTTAAQSGRCVFAVSCADDKMCKCQTSGIVNVEADVTEGAAVAGAPVFLSESTAGSVSGNASPAASDYPIGIFYTATAVSGTVSVQLQMKK